MLKSVYLYGVFLCKMRSAIRTKAARYGQHHKLAKLTARDIELIFELRTQGLSLKEISVKMECSKTHVNAILKGLRRTRE